VVVGDVETHVKSSTSRYSRVSVDEMDIERMFEKTASSMDDQESSAADLLVQDPLSPTDSRHKGRVSSTDWLVKDSVSLTDELAEDPQPSADRLVKCCVSSTEDYFSQSEDPLSPTDYTLQVDDDEEELNRLDTLP